MKLGRLFLSPLCLLAATACAASAGLSQKLLVAPPLWNGPPPLSDPPGPSLQPITFFNNAAPDNAVVNDQSAATLGFKFWGGTAGSISAISFYRGATSSQGCVMTLYSATGAVLASVYMSQETRLVPGWQVAQFASPISISANTTDVAAYYAPSGQYADQPNGLSQGASRGPLNVPAANTIGGNGVYSYSRTFPQSTSQNDNYFVDVLFTPIAQLNYLPLSFSPPNPKIAADAALGSVVTTVTAGWNRIHGVPVVRTSLLE